MNDHQITAKRMAGQRLSSEERDYLSDQDQEDRRMEIEKLIEPHHMDTRVTTLQLDGDASMLRSIRKVRLVFETYVHSAKAWRPTENRSWDYVTPHAKIACNWTEESHIKMLMGMEAWLAPRLVKNEEVAPGVWEFWVERRTSD